MMAHAQKPDFVFRAKRRSPFKSARWGASVQSTAGTAEVCGISGNTAGYTVFRGSVKSTGYSFHSPVSPSLPLPCVTVCHHISTGAYCPYTRTHGDISQTNATEERPGCSRELKNTVMDCLESFLNITTHGKTMNATGI